MHWLQVVAPALAVVIVIGIAILGIAFVSAVETFQRIFGPSAAADPAKAEPDNEAAGNRADETD
ncbi:MAG TPA: hypothetical protein VN157_02215 [Caulobacter sp.]|nr:hypothetical protein [Caulobacter sp.]